MLSDRRLIVLLCATMLANTVSMGAFPPLLPEVSRAGRLSDWQLGTVAGAFGLARTIADIPVGLFVTRNLRRALLVAPLGLIAGALCLGSGGSFLVLVVGRALMGVGHALAIVAGLTAVLRYRAGGHLAASLNAFEFSAIVGMLGGVMLVGALPGSLGWNVAYLVACAPLLVGVALVPGMLRSLLALDVAPATPLSAGHPTGAATAGDRKTAATAQDPADSATGRDQEYGPTAENPGGSAPAGDPAGAAAGGDPAGALTARYPAVVPLTTIRRAADAATPAPITPLAVLAFVAGATVAISYSTLEQFLIPLRASREFGLDRAGIAGLLSIAQFCDLLCLLPLGVLADRYRPQRVLGPVLLAIAAAVAAITFGGFTLVLVGCVLFGLGMAGWMLPLSLLRQETPVERVAWRTAVYRVGVDGGLFLGPFVSGFLGERRVGWLTGLFVAVLIGTAAMLVRGSAGSPRTASRLGRGT